MKKASGVANSGSDRFHYIFDMLIDFKSQYGDRLLETRNLFGNVTLIDPHTHSDCDDGRGTISQNYEAAMACGLDYVFITDHNSIEAQKYSRMLEGISWGQEPVFGEEHVVTLNNKNILKDTQFKPGALFAEATRSGRFAFIPHPAGQGDAVYVAADRAGQLIKFAGREFAMEILNGLFKVFRSWDSCCASAVEVWDQLLLGGCRITPLGGSDAHDPFSIGTAWTGLFCDGLTHASIIRALDDGRCFASEAAMLDFQCCDCHSGGVLQVAPGQQLSFSFRAADYYGLQRVRLIADGEVIHVWDLDDAVLFEEELTAESHGGAGYFRLEAISRDDRRAFSAPLYTVPAK